MDRTARFVKTPGIVLLVSLACFHVLSLLAMFAESPSVDVEVTHAEHMLRQAGANTDGAGLLAFIRARTLSDEQRKELTRKVRQFGNADFAVREKASRELIALGRAALPYLRPAVRDPDLETSRRARRCIEKIERSRNPSLLTLAALLVKVRRPPGAVPVLLAYLPSIDDDALQATWLDTLRVVGWNAGRADPALLAALGDKQPLLRAAAAHVLTSGGDAGVRQRVAPLLADADARVRFEAAAGLARAGDKKAVAILLALLDDGPFTLGCQSEFLLRLLADGHGPKASLDQDTPTVRHECRHAWKAWWEKHRQHIDLSRLRREKPRHGLTLLCESDEESSRVWEYGQGGQSCWEILDAGGAHDAQPLPGGRVLIAEHDANRVTERDHTGKILWQERTTDPPIACHREADGRTLIVTYRELFEVRADHRIVFRHTDRRDFRDALRLPNGHILYITSDGVLEIRDALCEHAIRTIELEQHAEGARYRARVELLPNGRYLLTLGGCDRVVEVDEAGKIRWQHTVRSPMAAMRLRNGHTLIACFEDRCVLEVDRAGKEISKQSLSGRPYALWRR